MLLCPKALFNEWSMIASRARKAQRKDESPTVCHNHTTSLKLLKYRGRQTFSHCGPVAAWHYFVDRPSTN